MTDVSSESRESSDSRSINSNPTTPRAEDTESIIDVRGMTKRFGSRTVVNDIALQVRRGEIYGFLGPNGSGKTTFIRMLCGLLKCDAGEGTVLGYDIFRQNELIKRHVGYMTQKFSFWEDLTIAENLDFVARIYEVPKRREAVLASLERLGLADRSTQLAGELSGGWKQRLALAACLIHTPQLLLLDEPTAGVDPKARREFWDQIHSLAAEGLTFLITTHYMDEAERCHRLAYIAYGDLLTSGTVAEVIEGAGLHTWVVSFEGSSTFSQHSQQVTSTGSSGNAGSGIAADLARIAAQLKAQPGVEQAAAFGNALHVSGTDEALVSRAVATLPQPPYRCEKIRPSLEDVFIHLMSASRDNFATSRDSRLINSNPTIPTNLSIPTPPRAEGAKTIHHP